MMTKHPELKNVLHVLADRIRTRRKALRITQEQLAERADLSANFVARLELADKTPSLNTIVQLASALGVSVADLFQDTGKEVQVDEALVLAHALEGLSEPDIELLMDQFLSVSNHLRRLRKGSPPT